YRVAWWRILSCPVVGRLRKFSNSRIRRLFPFFTSTQLLIIPHYSTPIILCPNTVPDNPLLRKSGKHALKKPAGSVYRDQTRLLGTPHCTKAAKEESQIRTGHCLRAFRGAFITSSQSTDNIPRAPSSWLPMQALTESRPA